MAISQRPGTTDEDAPSPWVGQRMMLEEFLALPEQKPALEYANGMVTQKMAPTPDHIECQAIFRNAFNEVAEQTRLGRTFADIRFRDGALVQVPDVGFYRRARLRTLPGGRYAPNQGVPDMAIEIVSPGQSVTSQILKCQRYLARGALIALVVDPDDEVILAFRSGQPLRVLQGDDRIDVDELLPGLALTVRGLFDTIMPRWVAQDDEAPHANQADDAAASERSDD